MQRTLSRTAVLLLLVSLALIGFAACPSSAPVIAGNKFTPSANSGFGKIFTREKQPLPTYIKFDGDYPKEWPAELQLPNETYILGDGKISFSTPRNEGSARYVKGYYLVKGFTKGSPDEIYDLLLGEVKQLDYAIKENKVEAKPSPFGEKAPEFSMPASSSFVATNSSNGAINYIQIHVDKWKNMGRWTYFTTSVGLNR